MEFRDAWEKTMGWEGGGRVHTVRGDPGGTTKYGISQRSHPDVDIANLSAASARAIAHRQYWERVGADHLPEALRWDVFDVAFNAGTTRAVKFLQQAINLCKLSEGQSDLQLLEVDGRIGPVTIQAASVRSAVRTVRVFRAYRRQHYLRLAESGRAKFIHGWLKRAEGDSHD